MHGKAACRARQECHGGCEAGGTSRPSGSSFGSRADGELAQANLGLLRRVTLSLPCRLESALHASGLLVTGESLKDLSPEEQAAVKQQLEGLQAIHSASEAASSKRKGEHQWQHVWEHVCAPLQRRAGRQLGGRWPAGAGGWAVVGPITCNKNMPLSHPLPLAPPRA